MPAAYKSVTLQVATDATYAPDESMKGTTMIGFDVDLMKAIATTLKINIKENNVTFDGIIAGITSGRYAVGNSSFTDTKAREKSVNFVDYFQAGEGVYAKSSSTLKFNGFSSFCGWKVAVETGTTEQTDATNASKSCPSSKKIDVVTFPTQTEANLAVLSGQANVGFVDSQIAGYIVSTSAGKFKLFGSAVNVAPYGIATPKTHRGKDWPRPFRRRSRRSSRTGRTVQSSRSGEFPPAHFPRARSCSMERPPRPSRIRASKMSMNGDVTEKVVPVRHVGRWLGVAFVAADLVAMIVHTQKLV